MAIDSIRKRYMGARAYHAVWAVSVYEVDKTDPVECFDYSVTFLNGSCSVILSDRFCAFYLQEGQAFNAYYGRAEEYVCCSYPDRFVAGLTGVSYRFAQLLPAWLLPCKRVPEICNVAVLANQAQAEEQARNMECGTFVVVPTDDNKIAYALYKGSDFFAAFSPGFQSLLR